MKFAGLVIVCCLQAHGVIGSVAQSPTLAQVQSGAPNPLDAQDQVRALERERDHADVRARLGEQAPAPPPNPSFAAPSANSQPAVPSTTPELRPNRDTRP
jgi:hypothetical protein